MEDDPLVIKYLENTLAQKNYNILTAETGQRARSIFKKHKDNISVLLTDAILPDVNGIELAEELQNQKKGLKVILSSGFSRKKALSSKTIDSNYRFIQKPYGIKELLQIMQDLLN